MSRFDYDAARSLHRADTPFYALLMAAMLGSDPHNRGLLRAVFPDVWDELNAREDAPDGKLPSDDVPVQLLVTETRPGDPGLRPVCPRCGKRWTAPACGIAHHIIGAEPRLYLFPR